MFQSLSLPGGITPERIRTELGRRATGLIVALLIEALLVLALFTLGQSKKPPQPGGEVLTTFDAGPEPEKAPEQPKDKPAEAQKPQPVAQPAPVQPAQPAPGPVVPMPPTPAFIPLAKSQMAAADISKPSNSPPAPASKPVYGPPDTGYPGDTQRVGTASNGQPLYAAAWYRKPYDSELSGYLSTAQGPGWGLIECQTAPDFRVENCAALGESPTGSNIARAVLAAAWQFKVRPPRVGGKSMVGAWVRIRIDYQLVQRLGSKGGPDN